MTDDIAETLGVPISEVDLKLADLVQDTKLLEVARQAAIRVLEADPTLSVSVFTQTICLASAAVSGSGAGPAVTMPAQPRPPAARWPKPRACASTMNSPFLVTP